MVLLLLLCVDDVTVAVENTVIHSGRFKNIFLDVLTKNSSTYDLDVRLETLMETTKSINLSSNLPNIFQT